ncbi:metallophosphoesterase [bacterium]|nr:metallophosphoesterase [bacterium]
MKIAVTADCHLTTRELHPERYEALEDIVEKISRSDITMLIIAGDLFDASAQNYAEFDQVCQSQAGRQIRFVVVPGNHDLDLRQQSFAAENVEIVTKPTVTAPFNGGLKLFLLPYRPEKTMGEFIASRSVELTKGEWVLVGHGDLAEGFLEPNPSEPGIYMPVTRSDLECYEPARVILGHIHRPMDKGPVYYPGSPCGLDIRETGRRRFLVLDLQSGRVAAKPVETKFIFFNESLVMLPTKNETAYLEQKFAEIIERWNLNEAEISKARIQLRVRGYTSDKRALLSVIKRHLQGFQYYKGGEPDLSGVSVSEDLNRAEIASQVVKQLEKFDWKPKPDDPTADDILLQALHVIYGE